jgi:hypothetical protein
MNILTLAQCIVLAAIPKHLGQGQPILTQLILAFLFEDIRHSQK